MGHANEHAAHLLCPRTRMSLRSAVVWAKVWTAAFMTSFVPCTMIEKCSILYERNIVSTLVIYPVRAEYERGIRGASCPCIQRVCCVLTSKTRCFSLQTHERARRTAPPKHIKTVLRVRPVKPSAGPLSLSVGNESSTVVTTNPVERSHGGGLSRTEVFSFSCVLDESTPQV